LQIPLINADRITASILPPADAASGQVPQWAQKLRDNDARWQILSQAGVQAFVGLVMEREMPFAFETVFSHWKKLPDGRVESKADIIKSLQAAGYFVVLLFVGLSAASAPWLAPGWKKWRVHPRALEYAATDRPCETWSQTCPRVQVWTPEKPRRRRP
jgi:hypothetical protein